MKTRRRLPLVETLEHRALMAAGALDPSFGSGGYITNPALSGTSNPHAAVQPWDGKTILAEGNSVYRYNADGSPDTGFGAGGLVASFGVNETPAVVVPDPVTQQIYIVGSSLVNNGKGISFYEFTVSRLNSNGSVDTTYGTNGSVTVAVAKNSWGAPSAAAIDSVDRLVVVGNNLTIKNYYQQDTILRFSPSGASTRPSALAARSTAHSPTRTTAGTPC